MTSRVWLDGEGISLGGVPLVTDDGPAAIVSGDWPLADGGPDGFFFDEEDARAAEISARGRDRRDAKMAEKFARSNPSPRVDPTTKM